MTLILASSSPRRRELLFRAGLDFRVDPPLTEEREPLPDELPAEYALDLAGTKSAETARRFPDKLVLAADTVVALDGVIFGKPRDEGAARIMLRQLRGRRHAVTTAVVARRGDEHWQGAVAAAVTMRAYSDVEIANYVATGEPLDKAGAYAVQGLGGKLVQSVEGCLNTVIGLPLCIVAGILSQAGYPAPRLQRIVCRHVAPR